MRLTNTRKNVLIECEGDYKTTWNQVKKFMEWKMSGSPHKIEVDNKLYRSAREVAIKMKEYFIHKVSNLRSTFEGQNLDLWGCRESMLNKSCRLSLNFVSV